ncbi:MAG: hypothetical protein ACREIU_05895, partial [Planctomycetota bacterium]
MFARLLLLLSPLDGEPLSIALGEEELIVTPPALEGRALADQKDEQLRARWTGKVGESLVQVEVRVYPLASFPLDDPEDVLDLLERNYADGKQEGVEGWTFDSTDFVEGKVGWIPYAALGVRAGKSEGAEGRKGLAKVRAEGDSLALGGLLEKFGYSVEILAHPALPEEGRRRLAGDLGKAVTARCRERNPTWTEEEVRERWKRDAPSEEVRSKFEKPIRTKHYLILTNSSGG